MTLPIGSKAIRASNGKTRRFRKRRPWLKREPKRPPGFTLVELLLVMAMLSIVLAVASPQLSKFFRGRTLDSEARRFLSLTRYGQSRAASEGIPMILWVDPVNRMYGLEADSTFVQDDTKAVHYPLSPDVQVQVPQAPLAKRFTTIWKGNGQRANVPKIQFLPDGSISESSPDLLVFVGRDEGQIEIATTFNRLNYAIQTNHVQSAFR